MIAGILITVIAAPHTYEYQQNVGRQQISTPLVSGPIVTAVYAAPMVTDYQQNYGSQMLSAPMVNQSPVVIPKILQMGNSKTMLASSQIPSQIFPSVPTPPVAGLQVPIRPVLSTQGQEQYGIGVIDQLLVPRARIMTQAVFSQTGVIFLQVGAHPGLTDLTLQANITKAAIVNIQAPWNPKTIVSVSQADPTQIPPQIFKSTYVIPAYICPVPVEAAPVDPSQWFGRIQRSAQPHYTPYSIPPMVWVAEQQYQNLAFQSTSAPIPGVYLSPGFRVMAVTAGWYGDVFRTPGDVFDIVTGNDFSDSTIDYQPASSDTVGFGWMQKVAPNTPLLNWLESNGYPALPPQDPLRRFIY